MRVRVDPQLCQGHTLCAMSAPTVFRLSEDDGHGYVEDPEVEAADEAAVRKAAMGCPEQAIVIEE